MLYWRYSNLIYSPHYAIVFFTTHYTHSVIFLLNILVTYLEHTPLFVLGLSWGVIKLSIWITLDGLQTLSFPWYVIFLIIFLAPLHFKNWLDLWCQFNKLLLIFAKDCIWFTSKPPQPFQEDHDAYHPATVIFIHIYPQRIDCALYPICSSKKLWGQILVTIN